MNREILKRMTKEELIELVDRQNQAIFSLDMQRYDSNAVIEHLVMATESLKDLRHHDAERDHNQEYLDDYVYQMYQKYHTYLVSADYEGNGKEVATKLQDSCKEGAETEIKNYLETIVGSKGGITQ